MAYKVAEVSDFEEGIPLTVRISTTLELVVVKRNNRFYALNNECPHMGGPLGEGEVEEGEIICPWHQFRFNIETGQCSEAAEEAVACYPTFVKGNHVYVEIKEAT